MGTEIITPAHKHMHIYTHTYHSSVHDIFHSRYGERRLRHISSYHTQPYTPRRWYKHLYTYNVRYVVHPIGMGNISILAYDYCEANITIITIIELTVFVLKMSKNCVKLPLYVSTLQNLS